MLNWHSFKLVYVHRLVQCSVFIRKVFFFQSMVITIDFHNWPKCREEVSVECSIRFLYTHPPQQKPRKISDRVKVRKTIKFNPLLWLMFPLLHSLLPYHLIFTFLYICTFVHIHTCVHTQYRIRATNKGGHVIFFFCSFHIWQRHTN